MKNAHLRFGWLTYVKTTEKTTTSIKLRLDRFIGEVLPDPPRQAKAHLTLRDRWGHAGCGRQRGDLPGRQVHGGRARRTADSSLSRTKRTVFQRLGTACRDARSPYVTSLGCRKSWLRAPRLRVRDEPFWRVRKADSFGPLSHIFTGSPECRTGLTGLQEN